jgi:hypothetical protein
MVIYVGDILALTLVLAGGVLLWFCSAGFLRHNDWTEILGIPIGIGLIFVGLYEMYLLRYDQVAYTKFICIHPGAC